MDVFIIAYSAKETERLAQLEEDFPYLIACMSMLL